jgi:ubiquinone biosynthesis protein COQ4
MGLIKSATGKVKAMIALARLAKDPTRLDQVFQIAEGFETQKIAEKLMADFRTHPQHAAALRDRPRLGHVDLEKMSRHAPGTLGRAVHDELTRLGIDPKDMVLPEGPAEFDYVRAHMRETHDIWHVVTGFDTDVAGELGLQAFYFAQFRAPLPPLLLSVGMVNTILTGMSDGDRRMRAIVRGWLMGRAAETFFGIRWAELFDLPLPEVRRRLGVDIDAIEAAIDRFDRRGGKGHAWHQVAERVAA